MGNYAYIDNQNLYMATKNAPKPWMVDMRRFRIYLREKYDVGTAYLFMGAFNDSLHNMYLQFQEYGYVLVWRMHIDSMTGNKKGNVDTDIVFQMMKDAYECDDIEGIVLVSGDGDYWRTIKHLKQKGKLAKVLLPSHKNASSLYKELTDEYRVYLDNPSVRKKFGK